MNEVDRKKVNDLIHSIGLKNNLRDSEVKEIVEAQFRFAYEEIRKLSFDDLTDEEIDNLKTNFYFTYIGKLYTNSKMVKNTKKRIDKIKEKKDARDKQF